MMTISTRFNERRPDNLPNNLTEWMGKRELVGLVLQAVTETVGFCHGPCVTDSEVKPIRPQVLLGLVCYGYATGVYGSWQIEEKISTDEAARYLAVHSHVDRQILRQFRRYWRPTMAQCLTRIFELAWQHYYAEERPGECPGRFHDRACGSAEELSSRHERFAVEAGHRIDCAMQFDRIDVEE